MGSVSVIIIHVLSPTHKITEAQLSAIQIGMICQPRIEYSNRYTTAVNALSHISGN